MEKVTKTDASSRAEQGSIEGAKRALRGLRERNMHRAGVLEALRGYRGERKRAKTRGKAPSYTPSFDYERIRG